MATSDFLYSLVIPVCRRVDDVVELTSAYAAAMTDASLRFEVIVVLDGRKEGQFEMLQPLAATVSWLRVIQFSRQFGESAALMAGFDEAQGDFVMTLPAYYQVEASELPKLIAELDDDHDVVIAVRAPRTDTTFTRLRRRVFHGMLRMITGLSYSDLGCGVRLLRRQAAEELKLYGDHYVFIPVLAEHRGFRVKQIELSQSPNDHRREGYNLRQHLHGLLNMMTVFFLHRFTKKPLRFFGSIGFLAAAFGTLFVSTLVVQRLFFGIALADRPALLLGSLLIVLGVQLFAIGLLGELVIFSHAAESKEYAVRTIVQSDDNAAEYHRDSVDNKSVATGR